MDGARPPRPTNTFATQRANLLLLQQTRYAGATPTITCRSLGPLTRCMPAMCNSEVTREECFEKFVDRIIEYLIRANRPSQRQAFGLRHPKSLACSTGINYSINQKYRAPVGHRRPPFEAAVPNATSVTVDQRANRLARPGSGRSSPQ